MSEEHTTEVALNRSANAAIRKARRLFWLKLIAALVGLTLIILAVNAFTFGAFLTPSNIINVLRQITYNAILAVGQTFVIITAGIDLSVGSLTSLTGVVMALFANSMSFTGPTLVGATLLVGAIVGAAAGFINAFPVVRLGLPPFITTLAMMLVARGAAYELSHGRPIPLTSDSFNNTGTGFLLQGVLPNVPGLPIPVLWLIVIVAFFGIVLAKTRFGRYVYAIGGNEEAARLAGIRVGVVKTTVYVISGICAAFAGLLLMARFSSGSPQTGTGYELQAIAAVVVGGTSLVGGRGSILGTFIGAFLIGVLNNVMNLHNIESYAQEIVLGGVILAAVVIDQFVKRFLRK
jgi:ribose/xylose/arabinose/galactoside ABC-type transport system permease subunit